MPFGTDPSAHVVVLPVPESFAYLNSVVLCDVQDADTTRITCLTRPHRSNNKGALYGLEPTVPGEIMVATCHESPKDDIAKLACWARSKESSTLAACDSEGACNWAYSADVTPVLREVLVNGEQGESMSFQDTLTLFGEGAF